MPFARMSAARRFGSLLVLFLLPLGLSASGPVGAFAGEGLFNKLAKVLVSAGTDPNAIEMARYTIRRPSEGTSVLAHAAEQDYPFFALVGAAKAGRGKALPGGQVFDQAACMTPVTAIDSVFGKADAMIDNAQGKQKTSSIVSAAKAIVGNQAKLATDQGKQEAMAELEANIPYFAELGTICSFAFETQFTQERNLQNQASASVRSIRAAFFALSNGDVVTGVSEMMKLGASADAACSLIDSSVGGGLIGRTPGLGSLAKGACSGFAGAVIDGASGLVKGGVGLVEDGVSYAWDKGKEGVCLVYSLFGSGCSKAAPPDPVLAAQWMAKKWCAPYGGVSQQSIVPGENRFRCTDGSQCRVRAGKPSQCELHADRLAWDAQQQELIQADFDAKLIPWGKVFAARWQAQCPLGNDQCRNLIAGFWITAQNAVLKDHKAMPGSSYAFVTALPFLDAENKARDLVDNERFRLLPPVWKARFDAGWSRRCVDAQCRDMALQVSDAIVGAVGYLHKTKPTMSYSATSSLFADASGAMEQEYLKALQRVGKAGPGPIAPPSGIKPGTIRTGPIPRP
ncbi:MAG: hypothetical protein H6916_01160 [Novosphingobium sp.]|uniref:hypothetical protein n=1 Tax=Novosphingobium sp. TaxID=1874826 RepID=UPI001D6B6970|nr:hypothetical protein [Novosphingobium sp.]MCB2057726.1 hypothetical protein [Novosphingobium sp.]MCP5385413.1 hypothetical protein [Novosphingobium sp.]